MDRQDDQPRAADRDGRIAAIEGLRAYLAWWVVAFHTLTTVWYSIPQMPMPAALLGVGGHAVTVFMILSGFVVFRLLDLKHESYPRYIVRRFLRIYPVFVASGVAMGTVLLVISASDAENLEIWPLRTLERYLIHADRVFDDVLPHLLLNAVMLQGVPSETLLPSAGFGFNPVAWSLSLEWQFYLIAPALLLIWRAPKIGPALLTLVVMVVFGSSQIVGPRLYPSFLPMSVQWFALGMMSWVLYKNRHRPGMLRLLAIGAIGTSALAAILCLGVLPGRPISYAQNTTLPVAIWMIFLTLLVLRERSDGLSARLFRIAFESRAILVLGQCSYSTYLWHRVILWLVMIGVAELLGSAEPWTLIWASIPLIVPAVLVVSLVSYRYIETPPIAFARRIGRRPAARPVGAASAS